eukprot:TRINITY_DN7613_c0_g2_i5.p1 TRINITY_DN7613_c0_g2~~TRINITY_DN7613_c0_g2_i5.p1  ORF type:complete len:557 (-),score=121.37 TRINITY_DN7613_c0_g2_i5:318-1988(-)
MSGVQATLGSDIAVKKALEQFRQQLMPVLTVDLKTEFLKDVKDSIGEQLRQELRKEMKQLSSKVAKDVASTSENLNNILSEQVKKIEQTSKDIQTSSTAKKPAFVKAPVKSNKRKSVTVMKQGFGRKPTYRQLDDSSFAENSEERPSGPTAEVPQRSLLDSPRQVEMSQGENVLKSNEPVLETAAQVAIDSVLTTEAFDIGMALVILTGAIMMGVSLQFGIDGYMYPFDVFSAVLFTLELMARFYCYRLKFFKMEGFEWNVFDLCIVICQIVAVLSQTSSATTGLKSLRGLRGLRAIRSLRVLRSLRLLRFVEEFRGVVTSMTASLKSTIGVLLLFTFGLYFGNLTTAMLTLYESVTGGLDWSLFMGIFLEEGNYILAFAYCSFIALCIFVLLNVLSAIFIGHALLGFHDDQDAMIVKDIDMLFLKGDLTSGDITWDEFQGMLGVREMVNLFKALNIDVSEARQLYRLLDTENVGVVDYQEFINGCLRLRGPAKSLELIQFMKDSSQMNTWTEKKLNAITGDVQGLRLGLLQVSQQMSALTPQVEEEGVLDEGTVE